MNPLGMMGGANRHSALTGRGPDSAMARTAQATGAHQNLAGQPAAPQPRLATPGGIQQAMAKVAHAESAVLEQNKEGSTAGFIFARLSLELWQSVLALRWAAEGSFGTPCRGNWTGRRIFWTCRTNGEHGSVSGT